jgi:hypothetical protein
MSTTTAPPSSTKRRSRPKASTIKFVGLYKGAAAHSKKNADALLSGARARRANHRAGSKGAAS